MYIIGIILLFILPFAAGCACKGILRWKETNQIETYLIGFFFLFFLQGVVLVPCIFLNIEFLSACYMLMAVMGVVLALGIVMAVIGGLKGRATEDNTGKRKVAWRKKDKLLYMGMMIVFGLLIVRMIMGMHILRDDIVLETVNTTVGTGTMFTYHPLTGTVMDGGMITSKKIVTLPLFYAAFVQVFGIEAMYFVYLAVNVLVLGCSYFACALLLNKVTILSRSKMYAYWLVYGLLLLSGDYHKSTLTYRLLYQGYEGMTICFGVLMPYLLYVILTWYRSEADDEKVTFATRIMYILKFVLVFACSMVITGLGTGFLFLFMTGAIAAVCCLIKSIKEVKACRE